MIINSEPVVDLQDYEATIKRNILSDEESYFLSSCKFLNISGRKYYRRQRYNTRLDAEKNLQKGEIIVETRIAAFILSLKEPAPIEPFKILNYI